MPDLSNIEAWKKAFIKDGMTDEQKAMAVWRSVVTFQHQEAPPLEFLQVENAVHDPIKMANVYGYSLCSVASAHVQALARAAGLQSRGWTLIRPKGRSGSVTFPIHTPGDIARVRIHTFYRARDAKDAWDVQVSFDGGKTFRTIDRLTGPCKMMGKAVVATDVPRGTRDALVRYTGTQVNTAVVLNFRIDADYVEPDGGFRPVKVTYVWDENGTEKRNEHIATKPAETYTIQCAAKPVMKSLIVELAR